MSVDKPWIVFQEYARGYGSQPSHWRIGRCTRQTGKMWFGHIRGSGIYKINDEATREYPEERRFSLELVHGRYATFEDAFMARENARKIQKDVDARSEEVKKEIAEIIRPHQDRLVQLRAEFIDRIRETMK